MILKSIDPFVIFFEEASQCFFKCSLQFRSRTFIFGFQFSGDVFIKAVIAVTHLSVDPYIKVTRSVCVYVPNDLANR